MAGAKTRLAIVVSHPIQYYAPLYQRLARRTDIEVRVFFTWHAGETAMPDHGFRQAVAWDIPLTEGYDFERVPNTSGDPGTHRFLGLRNPSLVERIVSWAPDAVHVSGWAWLSHLIALRALHARGIPVLFRGDSHLLDATRRGPAWWLKRAILERVYRWPAAFLYVGAANRAYYEAFGVEPGRLFPCPHSIDVGRFADRADEHDRAAADWRRELGIREDQFVLLFAGKFERKKRPLELMRAMQSVRDPQIVTVLVGGGELDAEVRAVAEADATRFRVVPFQNQGRMPVVYRLGDAFVLPSAYGETWGLAVNEAMACARPVIVSDRVGCAADVVDESCGRVFTSGDFSGMIRAVLEMNADRRNVLALGRAAAQRARLFDIDRTEAALMRCLSGVLGR